MGVAECASPGMEGDAGERVLEPLDAAAFAESVHRQAPRQSGEVRGGEVGLPHEPAAFDR